LNADIYILWHTKTQTQNVVAQTPFGAKNADFDFLGKKPVRHGVMRISCTRQDSLPQGKWWP